MGPAHSHTGLGQEDAPPLLRPGGHGPDSVVFTPTVPDSPAARDRVVRRLQALGSSPLYGPVFVAPKNGQIDTDATVANAWTFCSQYLGLVRETPDVLLGVGQMMLCKQALMADAFASTSTKPLEAQPLTSSEAAQQRLVEAWLDAVFVCGVMAAVSMLLASPEHGPENSVLHVRTAGQALSQLSSRTAPYAGMVDHFAAATRQFQNDGVDRIGARGLAQYASGLYAHARQHARSLQGQLVLRPMSLGP